MTSQSMPLQASAPARSNVLQRVLATESHLAGPLLRLTLAVVMFPHGAQKLLGWWGGYGFEGTMGFLTGTVGLPWILGLGVVLLEFFGPLLLLAGLATRPVALAFAGIMVGAIASVHGSHGFFMNWSGAAAGEGFEYHLLVIGMALALATLGGGRLSADRKLAA